MKTAALLGLLALFPAGVSAAGPGVAVVELFTSEGCSSCPPADRVLADLATRPGVFALEFHVDSWNSLGWKDPFSDAAYSARQRAYAATLGEDQVYTPQMIVNGTNAFVGSNLGRANAAIAAALARPSRVALSIALHGAQLAYRAPGAPRGAILCVALVDARRVVRVTRGENAGRTLAHSRVVRAFLTRPIAASGEGSIELPVAASAHGGIVAFVQEAGSSEVLGASAMHPEPELRPVAR